MEPAPTNVARADSRPSSRALRLLTPPLWPMPPPPLPSPSPKPPLPLPSPPKPPLPSPPKPPPPSLQEADRTLHEKFPGILAFQLLMYHICYCSFVNLASIRPSGKVVVIDDRTHWNCCLVVLTPFGGLFFRSRILAVDRGEGDRAVVSIS
uniref:Uncharacterized protein n=1 Tax=Ananas comosus var. bracteatus TaxID=296719 RepID=A0A6V7NW05_ANACO|nr:unnamed protein product [Ananas comosus var. bracteatus]